MKFNKELGKKILNGVVIVAGIITTADQVASGVKNVQDKLGKKDNTTLSKNKTEEV